MKCPVIAIVIPLLTEIALTTYKLSYVTLQCLVDSGHSLELYHMLFPLLAMASCRNGTKNKKVQSPGGRSMTT